MWIVAHKTSGIIYALGDSQQNAWANAVLVCYGVDHDDALGQANTKAAMRKEGWTAQRCTIQLKDGRTF